MPIFNASIRFQSGTVLPTSMVFVAVLSLIGVSAVQVTQTQVRLAQGEESRTWVFQQASSAIENTVADDTTWPLAMQESNALCKTIDESQYEEISSIQTGTRYVGSFAAAGYSISSNVPCCANHKFQVQGTASRVTTSAQVEQGMRVIGPKNTAANSPDLMSSVTLALACADM